MESMQLQWLILEAPELLDITQRPTPGIDWTNVLLLGVGLGSGLLLMTVGVLFFRVRRRESAAHASGSATAPDLEAGLQKKLQDAETSRDFMRAGELLRRAGEHEEAADRFLKGREYLSAAEAFQAAGNTSQAIHFFKKAGRHDRAAELYLEENDYRGAAAAFVKVGDAERAATNYLNAGDHLRAAQQYSELSRSEEAARHFEKANSPLLAAKHYTQAFRERLDPESGIDDVEESTRHLGRKAAELFEDASRWEDAARLYRWLNERRDAARCLEAAGESIKAARLYRSLGDSEKAVELLESAGDEQRAHLAKAEVSAEAGEWEAAAEHFKEASDLERAARVYARKLGQPEKAAKLLEEAEEWLRASELYEAAGNLASSADCAERGGALARASELYKEAGDVDGEIRTRISQGDYFRAGRLLYEQRRYDKALETLQGINSRDPIYRRGLELQGDVHRAKREMEDAYSRYRAALGNRDPSPETVRIYYKMARVLEADEDFAGAADHYREVLEVAEDFEDAGERLNVIEEGLADERDRKLANRQTSKDDGEVESDGFPAVAAAADGDGSDLRYDFVSEIARGGMGIVYRARDTFLNRIVAVKCLGEKLRDNETAVKYFLREARAAAALSHPNIVTIYDAGEQQGEYYIAMEYVEGRTLKEIVNQKGAIPEDYVRHVMIETCKALEYAHSQNVIHRDIKSGNIMCKPDRTVKVMDFGLAKFLREYKKNHTQQVGTPYYMSPEQIVGKNVDFRSDLYGLGCTAFECVTGRVPFTEGELAYHHVHSDPPKPSTINTSLSEGMEKVILKLLAKRPDDRYQSATDLREALGG